MVTVAVSDFALSACEIAFTVTLPPVGTVAGAVYKPVALIVPKLAALAELLDKLQVTAVFVVPVTVAVNCCVWPVCTETVFGVTATITGGGGFVPLVCPVQAASKIASGARSNSIALRESRRAGFGAFTGHSRIGNQFLGIGYGSRGETSSL